MHLELRLSRLGRVRGRFQTVKKGSGHQKIDRVTWFDRKQTMLVDPGNQPFVQVWTPNVQSKGSQYKVEKRCRKTTGV